MTRPDSELAHLFRALKAPAAARALPKLADRARTEDWSFEQFAATLLKTEVDSRDSHGGQSRIKAARSPVRKTLEDFDFAFQSSLRRDTVLHLGQLDFLAGRKNVVLLGPPKGPAPSRRPWPQGGGGFQFLRPTQCVSARAPSQRYAWPVPEAGVPPRRVAARRCRGERAPGARARPAKSVPFASLRYRGCAVAARAPRCS